MWRAWVGVYSHRTVKKKKKKKKGERSGFTMTKEEDGVK